jgi:osmoprotectant transport system ATP-binding protein
VCGDHLTAFKATVSADEHLRIVLSKMYQFNSSWMPVLDGDGRYIGEVTQDSIADYLSSGRSRGQTGKPAIVSPAVVAAEAAAAHAAVAEHATHS